MWLTPSCRKPHVGTSAGIVIVGGGLAAARTAEQLRRSGYGGAVTIVSDEDHLPYDRPPLSKEVLRAEVDDVTLKPAEFYEENDITVRLGNGSAFGDTHRADGDAGRRYRACLRRTGHRDRARAEDASRPSRISRAFGFCARSMRASPFANTRARPRRRWWSAPASSAARSPRACAAWVSMSFWWNHNRRRSHRCSASRSARW